MAGQWKKFGDKLGKQAEGPLGADWAAMEQKIAQTPSLQSKPLVGLMGKMVLTLLSADMSDAGVAFEAKKDEDVVAGDFSQVTSGDNLPSLFLSLLLESSSSSSTEKSRGR